MGLSTPMEMSLLRAVFKIRFLWIVISTLLQNGKDFLFFFSFNPHLGGLFMLCPHLGYIMLLTNGENKSVLQYRIYLFSLLVLHYARAPVQHVQPHITFSLNIK